MKSLAPDTNGIATAAELIAAGHIVAYPTETVYGLAADPFNESAIRQLFSVKARDAACPILLIVADMDQLREVVEEISAAAQRCIGRFWPGPLSLLFPKSPQLPEILTAGHKKIGVRQTAHPVARTLCRAVGHAITSTSANVSGQPPVRSLAELQLEGVAAGIDVGALAPSAPSTVYDPDTGRVLRQGTIPSAELLE